MTQFLTALIMVVGTGGTAMAGNGLSLHGTCLTPTKEEVPN